MRLLVFEPPKNCGECCFVKDEYGFFNSAYCIINAAWVHDYIFGEERPPICPLVDYKEVNK